MKVYIKIDIKHKFTSKSWHRWKKWKIKNEKNYKKNLKPYKQMNKKIIKYDDTEIKKYNFYQYKRPISIRNININKK